MRSDQSAGPVPRRRVVAALIVLLLAVTLLAVGCGDDDDDEAAQGGGDVTMKVGTAPIADPAPLFVGVEEGFFEDEGVTVEPEFVETGGVAVAAVVEGSLQAGFSNSVAIMSAFEKGLDLRVVSVAASGGETTEQGYEPLVVAEDSDIEEPADLEGKTIAISALKTIDEVTTKVALENAGVDVSSVEFVEVPRPDMAAAVARGRVDAATLVEPFAVEALETGDFRVVLDAFADAFSDVPVVAYFTTQSYAEQNPDAIAGFGNAIRKALQFSQENPEAVQEIIPTYTDIPSDIADSMKIPQWVPPSRGEWDLEYSKQKMTELAEAAVEYGVLEEVPDMDELFLEPEEQE